ncbi:unnamed protein product (macronuclear) [Paramecium tetraurelia]|uniref:Uncharacterized protein n=1 Tax=Paramecium tetraurelia TaxID=5888 RepID=A0CWU1_PARTE|nr:uncharacterized protein GSPATT00001461001 [Paramecium tetraurelia]CAK75258.1 unnamed protein product [Paramecium tetraurelia]|eukprot:XP_001442655.1 hypothetical protein (macronuclear) [Paramecium tetraurelia strain d4-2]
MLPPQQSSVEAQANLFENEQNQQLQQSLELKMNIILMATEIERLHKILISKKDYYEKKIQDLIDRELQDKEQIAKQAQAITELNQQIQQKNDLISQILQEKSQQEMNLLISQQLFVINTQFKNAEIYIQELQKENQLLKQQFEDAPSLRQKLYDLEQWYAKLIHEKNEEINLLKTHQPHIVQYAPQLNIINQLLDQKERELLQWQYSSQQVNLYRENQRLTQQLKFLNDKLNLLLFDNEHLNKRLADIQSHPSNQTTQPQYATLRGDSQCTAPILHDFLATKTPRRYKQQFQSILPTDFTNSSLLSYRIIKRPQSVGSGSSIHFLGSPPQLVYHQNQYSPRYSRKSLQNHSAQFNELLRQTQIIQNQPILTIQNIETQIQFLNHMLLIKRQELPTQTTPPRKIYKILKTQGNERTSSPNYTPPQFIIMKQPINLSQQKIQPSQQQFIPQTARLLPQNQLQDPNNVIKYRSFSAETKRELSPYAVQYQQQLIPQASLFLNQPQQAHQIQYKYSPIQRIIPQQNLQNTIPKQTQRSVSPQSVQYMPYQTQPQAPQTIRFQDLKQYQSVNLQPLQQHQDPQQHYIQQQQNIINYNLISQSQPYLPTQFGAYPQNPSEQNRSPIHVLAYPYDSSPQNPEDLNKTRQIQNPISQNPYGLFMTPNNVRKPVISNSNSSQPFSQVRVKRESQEPLSIRKQKGSSHQSNKSLPAQVLQSTPIDNSQVEPFELCNAPQEPDEQEKEPLKPEEIQKSPQLQDPSEQTQPKTDPQEQPIEQPKQEEQFQQPQNLNDQGKKNHQNPENLNKKPQKPYILLNKPQNPNTLSKPNQSSRMSSGQPIPQISDNQKDDISQPEDQKRSQPASVIKGLENKKDSLLQDLDELRKYKQELDRLNDLLSQAKLENEKLKEIYQQNDLNWQKQFQQKYTAALQQLQLFENKLAIQNKEYNQNIQKQKTNFNSLQQKFDEQEILIDKQKIEINKLMQN